MPRDRPSRGRTDAGPPSRELTEALELLRSPRRRFTIDYLDRTTGAVVDLEELADRLCEWEESETGHSGEESTREVYNDLYHVHVPKLSSAGVATYEPTEDAVRLETVSEPLATCLEVVRDVGSLRTTE